MIELPIMFLVGPSGVGKSHVSNLLIARFGFVFMDIDIHRPFGHYKIRKEWNAFETELNPLPLVSALRGRVDSNASGLLLSFPSRRILSRKHIDAVRSVGVRTVLLWGPYEVCKNAALGRQDGRVTSPSQYDDANEATFATYGNPEFDAIRVEVPRPEGGYWPDELLLNRIDALIDAEQIVGRERRELAPRMKDEGGRMN